MARAEPEKYLSIIIDGMDQQKTSLPFLVPESKSTQPLPRVTAHITGVLVHTQAEHGKLAFTFVDVHEWPHDSNLTINVLNKTLAHLHSK